jgi:hypothetical protein
VITDRRELTVSDNDLDADRAVAIEVKTQNGHTDVCFADGRPDRLRNTPEAELKVAGEFAFYSIDQDGLRQATLVGGRTLESPLVRIATDRAERRGTVTRVDYPARKMWIDQSWPARGAESVLEVGVPEHWTTYTVTEVEPQSDGSMLTLRRGGDYFRSLIEKIDGPESVVAATLRPLVEPIDHNRAGWVASDDDAKIFWRATYLGEGRFRLDGPPVAEEAFGQTPVLRLWEYGVGDTVRQSTSVSLRRAADVLELTTDVAVTVSLRGKCIDMSPDAKSWHAVPAEGDDGWVTVQAPASNVPLWLRLRQ